MCSEAWNCKASRAIFMREVVQSWKHILVEAWRSTGAFRVGSVWCDARVELDFTRGWRLWGQECGARWTVMRVFLLVGSRVFSIMRRCARDHARCCSLAFLLTNLMRRNAIPHTPSLAAQRRHFRS